MTTIEKGSPPSLSKTDSTTPASRSGGSSPLRLHVLGSVFLRNLAGYFSNPAGYVFIMLFVLASSTAAFWQDAFFANNLATLDTLNEYMPYLLLLFIPAITMSIWAEERRLGTDELLLTLPARDYEVVFGKFLAALGIYTVALGFSLSHVIILFQLGNPDIGVMFSTYLGYWLMGAMLIACGMVASVLSSNITVAFILGAVFASVPVFLELVGASFVRDASQLSVPSQFRPFGEGLIPLNGVFYFVSVTLGLLYVNMVLLERRHWAGGPSSLPRWVNYAIRTVSLAVILISLTILVTRSGLRADVTEERLHSLSPASRALIAELPEDRPIFIQFFYSPDEQLPARFLESRKDITNLLNQFEAQSGGKIRLNLTQTTPISDEAQEAESRFGITPQEVFVEQRGVPRPQEIFLGAAFVSGLEEVVVPFFDPGVSVEYELIRSIQVVSRTQRKRLGIVQTDAELMGGVDFMQMAPSRRWRLVDDLEQQYEVEGVSADAPISVDDFDVLLAAQPSSMTQPQIDNLTTYIKSGGPALLLVDPLPLFVDPSIAPTEPRRPPGGPFGGGQPPTPKGNLRPLLSALNVAWDPTEIAVSAHAPHPELDSLRSQVGDEVIFVTNDSGAEEPFNREQLMTSGLQEALLIVAGVLEEELDSGPEVTKLMTTDPNGAVTSYAEYLTNDPLGPRINPFRVRNYRLRRDEMALAVRVQGALAEADALDPTEADLAADPEAGEETAAEAGPAEVDVIVVADLDLVSDQFYSVRSQADELNFDFDNIEFVLNAIDVLAGDEAFISLRTRRPKFRTLSKLTEEARSLQEDLQQVRLASQRETQQRIAEEVEALQQRLDEIQSEGNDLFSIIEGSIVEQAEIQRRIEVTRANIEQEERQQIRQAELETEKRIEQIQNGVRAMAVTLPPMPALILGMFVFVWRISRENRGANVKRLA